MLVSSGFSWLEVLADLVVGEVLWSGVFVVLGFVNDDC